ncbi:MAG: 2OG-Fe(II) oxygenase [Alphaproteobacteria bacterium]|nr:2OG-Fe(II) oxygenase [Alphaproteobacteria bacterium]MBV9372871.1 2OG-Fe(II) oxygenase [Alphaproteobacteria bacterium]MBV9902059.1 2OG-Fe(II) oxygenase [Alphaproteobacteria bacterium]
MDSTGDLERRAARGDVEARFALGARLAAHPDSPSAFARGAAMIAEAAEGGHAAATAMLATIEAIGANRAQDWGKAFALLRRAAGLGSPEAGAQLRLLGEGDVAALLRVPERVAYSERPRLRVFPGFASAAECRWVTAKLRPRLAPALVYDGESGVGRLDPSRDSSAVELRLEEMDVVIEVLRARIAAATGLPEAIFEVPQVMHYSVGQQFTPHHDFFDPALPGHRADLARRGQRIGTFLIYLNDDFEGGETDFPKAGLSYRGGIGDALFFANVLPDGRPDPLTLHWGKPPTRGEKWIFSQWIRDRVPGPPQGSRPSP